jgi:hypothetical protein
MAQPTGSRKASADQSRRRLNPDRYATREPSIAPVQRIARRIASMTRVRGPSRNSPAAYTAARMWCAGEPLSSSSKARSSPSPRNR